MKSLTLHCWGVFCNVTFLCSCQLAGEGDKSKSICKTAHRERRERAEWKGGQSFCIVLPVFFFFAGAGRGDSQGLNSIYITV